MPAPEPFSLVAYAVIVVVPLAILVGYYLMYSRLSRSAITGGRPRSGPDPQAGEGTASTNE